MRETLLPSDPGLADADRSRAGVRASEHRAGAEISVLDDKQHAKIDVQELKLEQQQL